MAAAIAEAERAGVEEDSLEEGRERLQELRDAD